MIQIADLAQYFEGTTHKRLDMENVWEVISELLKYGKDITKNVVKFSKECGGIYSSDGRCFSCSIQDVLPAAPLPQFQEFLQFEAFPQMFFFGQNQFALNDNVGQKRFDYLAKRDFDISALPPARLYTECTIIRLY